MTQQQSEVLKQQYHLRFADMLAYRNRVWQILCADFFARYVPPTATILDVGSGYGEFINNITAAKKYAMDLNSASRDHLSAGITCIHQDCSQPWELETASLDVIFTSNFLEHLNDKESVSRTMAEAFRCLKKGGLIICLGPNIRFVPGDYWDFWDHKIPLTELSCSELLRMSGFQLERCVARFLPYSMSTGKKPPLLFVSLYLRLPFLWPLFGKQFLVMGRK